MRYSIFMISFIGLSSWGPFVGSARSLPHVMDYAVVRPQKLTVRGKRSASSTQTYPDELRYALAVEGQNFTLHLEKNRFLLGRDYTATHYLEDGTEVTTSPNHEDHCYYQGHIHGTGDSSVSVALCSGIRGFLRAEQQVYLIEPLGQSAEDDHAVYRQEHLRGKRSTCSHTNKTSYDHGAKASGLYKLGNWESKPFSDVPRFVELHLVVDKAEYKRHGESMKAIEERMLEIANHVDKLYRSVNIRVMLVGLEVWSYQDKIDVSSNPDETLTRFLQWRQSSLVRKKKHDNAQLVTGIDFEGSTVGLATKFAMCSGGSGAVNEDHNVNPLGVASTMAHEMGHNLGMSHDQAHCGCGATGFSKNCIMADSVGFIFPREFSHCSQMELRSFLEKANPSCLLDSPSTDRLFGGPVCGNAFLEAGEECDCGTVEECRNPCCNATTCLLKEGAQCAHGECCQNCQLKPAGSLCRKSAGDCDLEEFCTGSDTQCPGNAFKMNGLLCGFGQGYCYNGACPTHLQHCERLWGSGAQVAADGCFYHNSRGIKDGNCGRTAYGYRACPAQDLKCGKIFCSGGKEFPITGQKAILSLRSGVQCNIAVDPSETDDLGMVPTGTKCGANKVCYNSVCQDVSVYGTEECSAKCNSHGVCNHERACHCDPGWAPPFCEIRLADLPADDRMLVIGVSVAGIMLVVISLMIGGLLFFRKSRRQKYPGEKKPYSASGLSNPLFLERGGGKGSPRCGTPQISEPTFLESSATQACAPLVVRVVPTRHPPQPPKKMQMQTPPSPAQVARPSVPPPVTPNKPSYLKNKPLPPAKPLPLLNEKQGNKSKLPPVPPVKPTGTQSSWKQPQVSAGPRVALKPPTKPR
ncbi:disintegrin and metalloproteinase domain-containing protein 8a [Conger conger]|uniref:disintegrin and metalloproteinase domain-containing protein 8a n=1 Tax=Conger conger TaxID=82655 RepID=UPI002A59F600|nr:disintegrin and metalloproteinase domain-containing protein 8a [Conger conger]